MPLTLKSLVVLLFSSTAYSRLGSLNSIQLAEVPAMVSLATMLKLVPLKSAAPTMPVGPPPISSFLVSLSAVMLLAATEDAPSAVASRRGWRVEDSMMWTW